MGWELEVKESGYLPEKGSRQWKPSDRPQTLGTDDARNGESSQNRACSLAGTVLAMIEYKSKRIGNVVSYHGVNLKKSRFL